MNKILFAVLVAVCAATILEMAAARRGSHEHHHRRRRGNCSTNGNDLGVNLRCSEKCWKSSNGTNVGNCQNGNCTCYARNNDNGSTNGTTGRRSLELVQLPTFDVEGQAQKQKNPLFG